MAGTGTNVSRFRLFCKWTQLILSCVCIGLFTNAPIDNIHSLESILMAVTFGGYIIVQVGIVVGFACEERVPKRVDLFYTLLGLALFVAAGSVGISHFKTLSKISRPPNHPPVKSVHTGMATGIIAIINAAVFLFDAVLSYRDVNEYIPHE